jgi:hypothetical protein
MQRIDPEKLKKLNLDPDVEEVYLYLKAYSEAKERKAWLDRYEENWRLIENDIWEPAEKAEIREQKQVPICINDAVKGVQVSCAVQTANRPELKFNPIGSGDKYVADLLRRGHDVIWNKNENIQNIYDFVEEREIGGLAFIRARLDKNKGPFGKIVNETLPPPHVYFDKDSKKRDFSDTHLLYAPPRPRSYIMDHYGDIIKEDDLLYHRDMIQDVEGGGKSEGLLKGDNYRETGKDSPQGIEESEDIWEIEASMLKLRDESWIIYSDAAGEIKTIKVELAKGEKLEDVGKSKVPEGGTFINIWPRKREYREIRIIVGKKLIEKEEDPYGTDSDGDPICHIIGLKGQKTRTAYPISATSYARDSVRIRNKALMQFIHAQAYNNNAPLAEVKGAVTWVGVEGTPGSKAKVDLAKGGGSIGNAIQRIPSGTVQTAHFLEIMGEAKRNIDDVYDAPPVVKGEIPEGTDPSGRTVLALSDMAGTASKPKLSSEEGALVRLAKVNIAIALQKWHREQWKRLIEKDEMQNWLPEDEKEKVQQFLKKEQAPQNGMMSGMPSTQPMPLPDNIKKQIAERWEAALELIRPADYSKPPGIEMIDLDVGITAGSSMPTNRIAKREIAREDFKMGLIDRKAALKYADDPEYEEISARMDEAEQAKMQMELTAKGMKSGA